MLTSSMYLTSRQRPAVLQLKHLVQDMLFADDSALVAHTADDMQKLVDRFSEAAAKFSLKINIKKTECLYQPEKLNNYPTSSTASEHHHR